MKKLVFIALLLSGFIAHGRPVNNFKLQDSQGKTYELYDFKDHKAVVIVAHSTSCPILRQKFPDFERLSRELEGKKVKFFYLNSISRDSLEQISKEQTDYGLKVPILKDPSQVVVKDLNLKVSSETLVIDPSSWERIYKGPIDDQVNYELKKKTATPWLKNAILSHLKGQVIQTKVRRTYGCYLDIKG